MVGGAILFTLIGAAPGHFVSGGVLDPLLYGATLGVLVATGLLQRSVTVMDEGLWVSRSYTDRFFCQWSEVVAVERRQLGPFAFDQLLLREPVRKFFRSTAPGPPDISWRPTGSKRIAIGLYDRAWRTGPIGAAMSARGVSLEAVTRTNKPAVT